QAGIAVPPGFVVRTAGFEAFIAELERREPLRALVEGLDAEDLEGITRVSGQLRARIASAPVPTALATELNAALQALCGADAQAPLAVRSSATTEDAEDASFAGLQDTYLWVKGSDAVLARSEEHTSELQS